MKREDPIHWPQGFMVEALKKERRKETNKQKRRRKRLREHDGSQRCARGGWLLAGFVQDSALRFHTFEWGPAHGG